MAKKTNNPIVRLTHDFALEIIDYTAHLDGIRQYIIARQLQKSGTSIGANVSEAQNAESRADFIHKLKIAAKEASETLYWISLCNESEHLPTNPALFDKAKDIAQMIGAIITKSRNWNRPPLNSSTFDAEVYGPDSDPNA